VCLPIVMLLAQAAPAPAQMPTLPLTQLDERAAAADLDNRVFSLTFGAPTPIGDLLLLLVRGTSLSVVPDPSISGTFTGELKNVTVRRALTLILPPLGLDYTIDGSVIRVFRRPLATRIFDINLIAADRSVSSTSGEAGAAVKSAIAADAFADLGKGVRSLLSAKGTLSVDRQAGLIQVTDTPDRIDRVAQYLDAVRDRTHRQVQIDARVLEVELNDPQAQDLDWSRLALAGRAPRTAASASPGARIRDVPAFLAALADQGKVSLLASPRVLVLNNEPAIVQGTSRQVGEAGRPAGVTITVTPQIAQDGTVTMAVGPVVTLRDAGAPDRTPDGVSVREADTLAQVANGDTMVMSGFWRDREIRQRRTGWFGRSTVVRKRVALVVLLTPTVVNTAAE
jgi:MSHA biogenesis protein MshL